MKLAEFFALPVTKAVIVAVLGVVIGGAGVGVQAHKASVRERAAVAESIRVVRVEVDRSAARCDSLAAALVRCRAERGEQRRIACASRSGPSMRHESPCTPSRPGLWSRNSRWIIPVATLGVGVALGAAITAGDVAQTTIVTVAGTAHDAGKNHKPKHRKCK